MTSWASAPASPSATSSRPPSDRPSVMETAGNILGGLAILGLIAFAVICILASGDEDFYDPS